MKTPLKQVSFLIVVAFIAFISCWASNYSIRTKTVSMDAHEFLHKQLGITEEQDHNLESIEARFAERKIVLEGTIREVNAELGKAIMEDKRYSDRVKVAVDKIHSAQGELQKLTIEHLFEMQTILTPQQSLKLNHMAADALIHHP